MKKLGAFILGGLVGGAIALLYAPRTGKESRELVCEKVNAVWGEAKDWTSSAPAGVHDAFQTAVSRGDSLLHDMSEKGQKFAETARERGQQFAENARERGAQFAETAREKGQQAYSAVTSRVTGAPASLDDANDELREKIEAARQRISDQVIRNAEESTCTPAQNVEHYTSAERDESSEQ
ncbi:YtxH domain-containing protein [Eggerthellaceae bacterium PR-HUZ602407-17]